MDFLCLLPFERLNTRQLKIDFNNDGFCLVSSHVLEGARVYIRNNMQTGLDGRLS